MSAKQILFAISLSTLCISAFSLPSKLRKHESKQASSIISSDAEAISDENLDSVEIKSGDTDEGNSSFLNQSSALKLLGKSIILTNAAPAPDSVEQYRMGDLQEVAIPSSSSNPYPITYTSVGPFTDVLPENYGKNLLHDKMRKQLLDAHNYVRKLETASATYMNKLVWDYSLEAYALQWTQYLCTAAEERFFEHSPDTM
eukprot:Selendium_serpulae@DN1119_c0_g1_i2.p1